MNKEAVAKAILSEYPKIEILAEKLTKTINKTSIEAAYNEFGLNFLDYFNTITLLIERKNNLINLKLLTDDAILNLPEIESKILCLKYMDNFTNEQIADVLNISVRNIYRKISQSINHFSNNLFNENFNENFCKKLFISEPWLKRKYCEFSGLNYDFDSQSLKDFLSKIGLGKCQTKCV